MTKKTDQTIRNCFTNLSNIFRETAAKSSIAESDGLQTLTRLSQKLDAQDLPTKLRSAKDTANDSLEKVSFYIDLALNTFETISGPMLDADQYANFIFALSETLETLGNYERALANYSTALNSSASAKDRSLQGKIQYRMARIHSEMGQWDRATKLLNEAIVSLETARGEKEVALAKIELGKIAFRKGEYTQAQEIFNRALASAERANDVRARAIISNHLGIIKRMEADYDAAYLRFQEALIDFQSIQDFRGTADTLSNLGLLHLKRREQEKGIEYFDKAVQMCQEIGYFALLPFVYLHKTEYYCDEGDYAMAANTCARALENLTRLKNPIGIAKTNLLFGRIFWKSGDHDTARQFYDESVRLYSDFDIPFGLANCLIEYADMLKTSGMLEQSEKLQVKAARILKKLRSTEAADGHEMEPTIVP